MLKRDSILLGGELIMHLAPLIGLKDGGHVRKIIIVASHDAVTEIHVEMLNTKVTLGLGVKTSLLDFDPAHLEGAKIRIIAPDDSARGPE